MTQIIGAAAREARQGGCLGALYGQMMTGYRRTTDMRHLPVALALAGALAATGCTTFGAAAASTIQADLDKVNADTDALVVDSQTRPIDLPKIAADIAAARNDWATLIADYKAAGKKPPAMPPSLAAPS